jgi:hypothetical protein
MKGRPANVAPEAASVRSVTISFPDECKYVGGHSALGSHGHHFRIDDGRLGHGEFRLTHSIPLSDVVSVTIAQRGMADSTDGDRYLAFSALYGNGKGLSGAPKAPRVTTDITVRTKDGQEARWTVEQRDGGWVHDRLSPALGEAGIRLD